MTMPMKVTHAYAESSFGSSCPSDVLLVWNSKVATLAGARHPSSPGLRATPP